MSSRVGGALALGAAALVAIALVTSAWWHGHPNFQGKEMEYKTAGIGLRGGTLCNTEGDGKCRDIPLSGGFLGAGIATTIVGGLAILGLVALGIGGLRGAARRKQIAQVALGGLGALAVPAIVFILLRPASADIPIGYGMILFWIGTITGAAAGVVTMRSTIPRAHVLVPARPTPVPVAAPAAPVPAPAPAPAPAMDVMALFGDELRTGGEHALPPPPAFGAAPAYATPQRAATDPFPPYPPPYVPPPSAPPAPPPFVPQLPADPYAPPPEIPGAGGMFGTSHASTPYDPMPMRAAAAVAPPAIVASVMPALTAAAAPTLIGAPVIPLPPLVAPPIAASTLAPLPPPGSPLFPRIKPPSFAPPIRSPLARVPGVPPIAPMPIPAIAPPTPPPLEQPSAPVELVDPTDAADHTDAGAEPIGDDTSVSVAAIASDSDRSEPIHARASTELDDVETAGRERIHPDELEPVISSAARHDQMPSDAAPAPVVSLSTAPASLAPPTADQVAATGPSPACPQCEAPMAWVELHLRFFCKACRMYF